MSDPNDNSIPVLREILVPGHRAQARPASSEPVFAPQPSPNPEPVLTPEALHARESAQPETRMPAAHVADHLADQQDAAAGSVFDRAEPVAPLEAGTTVPPDVAHETVAQPQAHLDADVIAERLRGRFAGFLTGEGRGIIEARCRDALQDHAAWLVNHITREVALTLETEMTGWVREAVAEEIARRSGNA